MSNNKRAPNYKTAQDREIAKMLVSGEEVILQAKLHWAIYWKATAVLVFALLLFIYIPPLGMLAGLCGVFLLCVAILTQHFLILTITNKRVLARYGLLQMDVVDIRLSKVESIDLERMLPGHMLGYASVVVMGTGQRLIRIQYIANAESFRRYYNEMVLAEEGNEDAEREINQIKQSLEDEDGKSSSGKRKTNKR
tara:strand:- start:1500 stop:2084 length:585 start_codon:yes stop_codon:yes gene_type:complete